MKSVEDFVNWTFKVIMLAFSVVFWFGVVVASALALADCIGWVLR